MMTTMIIMMMVTIMMMIMIMMPKMIMSRNRGQKSRLLTDDNDDGRVRERRKTLDKEVSNKVSPPLDYGGDDDGRVREKRLRTKRSPIHPTPPIHHNVPEGGG